MENEKSKHEPHYLMMAFTVIFVVITFLVAWNLVMNVSTHYISGNIIEVMYKDNGFASDSVKVFFANVTGNQDVLEINFNANTYYNFSNSYSGLDGVYRLLKENIGERVEIEYTKPLIGDIGFVNCTVL